MGANSFLYEKIPISMGGNNENDRVASPESVSIHLKHGVYSFKKEAVSVGANSFLLKFILTKKGGKNGNSVKASPGSISMDL